MDYFLATFPRLIQSSVKMTKNHLDTDVEIYKEQRNGKVNRQRLTEVYTFIQET